MSYAFLWDELIEKRNLRLAACDWTQMPDSALSDTKKAEWAHQKFVEAGVFERVELDSTAFYKRLFRCDFYDEASSILESR